jgi:hypothetical protein
VPHNQRSAKNKKIAGKIADRFATLSGHLLQKHIKCGFVRSNARRTVKTNLHRDRPQKSSIKLALALAFSVLLSLPARPCTIFLLTDTNHVLFCNNEDWFKTNATIWFVPAEAPTRYGCVYVGFADGFPQGGMNTEGLASDWVSGYEESWKPDPKLPPSAGSRQLLETCATVEEAIAFFRGHRELGFYTAKILVADPTGASAIIGASNGKLHIEKSNQCRGFGYGETALDTMLTPSSKATVAGGADILRACLQKGKYATRYSNIFDLKSRDIFLFPFPEKDNHVKLNLKAELDKGAHYYDMHQINEQLARAPQPLLASIQRGVLNKLQPIPDMEPKITAHIHGLLQDMLRDTMRPEDYTPESWKEISTYRKRSQAAIKSLGELVSLALVERTEESGNRCYRYRVEFKNTTVLQRFVLDHQNKVLSCPAEDIQ